MARGLYRLQDGSVMVDYGPSRLPISRSHYLANGYKPIWDRLPPEAPAALAERSGWIGKGLKPRRRPAS